VLPGGTPRDGESMTACARRELLEETSMSADPCRVALVVESVPPGSCRRLLDIVFPAAEPLGPGSTRRTVDLVFLAAADGPGEPEPREPDLEARFVPLGLLPGLDVRPPLAGHLRALHARGAEPTAAYLGNLWRPQDRDGMRPRGQDVAPPA
jgi:8-oxo-dGTP diphosphatase